MDKTYNLDDFSENELNSLIDEATALRDKRHSGRAHERSTASDGSKGQDVHDPDHGVITAPTPRQVEEEGSAHGVADEPPRTVE